MERIRSSAHAARDGSCVTFDIVSGDHGEELQEVHVLADGARVVLRPIRPADADELRRGFERLSPESRYRRFFRGVQSLDDATLRYLTDVDGRDHVAVVAVTRDAAGVEHGLGVARFVRTATGSDVAEAAITVIDDEQHKGIGRLLALSLARAAHDAGIRHFRGEVLDDNAPVRQLLGELGATLRRTSDGLASFDVQVPDDPSEIERMSRAILRAAANYPAFVSPPSSRR